MNQQSLPPLWDCGSPHSAGYRDIDPVQLAQSALPRIVDVREPEEFAGELGHVPNAELHPLATVESASKSWVKSQPILLVCRSGARSRRACEALIAQGFRQPMNLTGGMLRYHEAKLPVER